MASVGLGECLSEKPITSTYREDPLFSPENLRRLAELQRQEEEEEAGFCLNAKSVIQLPNKINITGLLDGERLKIPVRMNAGNLICDKMKNYKIDAEIQFNISANSKELCDAYKMKDRSERVAKIRELFQIDDPVCQLTIPLK